VSTVYWIWQTAQKWGYDPAVSTVLKDKYVKKTHPDHSQVFNKKVEKAVVAVVERNQFEWEKNLKTIALDTDMSAMTVWWILKWLGYEKRRPSWKPDLTPTMKEACLQFALWHQNWTLKDWKNIIWTDETSIVLRHCHRAIWVWQTV